ncbi:virB8 family protein [Marilutibacter alkalisoli]|uniref:Type IV secretion system protein n=1 Tax=Marilutibacter alkalisoli TaxID=2591633 RepID=A0A514BVF8_9GAMM|nr:type IV secretion system protein [Lysobacter alkalisoli]QDH71360.1 type IV secretion system protein [Lysobacter alkalisoli]
MFGKKTSSPQVDQAVAKAVNYELTVADLARRSQRRAWLVAWCAIVMSLILASGYFVFLPLKEKVPYLVMADPYTGTATVARLQGNFGNNSITTQEAINKSNVARFVLARESYDSGLVGNQNWYTVFSMAGERVAPAYKAVYAANNPNRPATLYGATKSVHVRIVSIHLLGGGGGQPYTGATVRFQRSLYDKTTGRFTSLDNSGKIATLEFTYRPNLKLGERDRLLNPLGFQVTNYRVENDFAEALPPEPAFPSPAELMQRPSQSAPPVAAGTEGSIGVVPDTVPPPDFAPEEGQIPANPDAAAPANGVNTQ